MAILEDRTRTQARGADHVSAKPPGARRVLVTGGSDGLGRELVRQYAREGATVYAVARSERGLRDELPAVRFIEADLARPEAVEAIAAAIGPAPLDLLVHNAAGGWFGPIEAQSAAVCAALLELNLAVPLRLTHVLAARLGAARGAVAFVGSVAAFVPVPRYAVYGASKAALDGLARSLQAEWRGRVRVLAVHPGPIATEFHARSGVSGVDLRRLPSAERVARGVVRSIEGRRWRAYSSAKVGAIARAGRLAATLVDRVALARERRRRDDTGSGARSVPPNAVVTGAASGLGAALVDALLARGHRVWGVDLDLGRMRPAGAGFQPIAADLSDPAGCSAAARALPASVALYVHCAGTSAVGPFESIPTTRLDTVWRTNLLAPIALTAQAFAERRLDPGATVVLVASLSHYVGYPGAAVYAASKDGLAAYGRSLDAALRATGRRCLTVFPGPMRTPHARAFAPPGASEGRRADPARVAAAILDAVEAGRRRLVPGAGARLAAIAGTLAPDTLTRAMGATLWPRLRDGEADAIIARPDE